MGQDVLAIKFFNNMVVINMEVFAGGGIIKKKQRSLGVKKEWMMGSQN